MYKYLFYCEQYYYIRDEFCFLRLHCLLLLNYLLFVLEQNTSCC